MKAFSNELSFEVTWKPYFLNPTVPDSGIPLEQYLAKKYGPQAAEAAKNATGPLSQAGANVVKLILMEKCWKSVIWSWLLKLMIYCKMM